ncbi:3-deoxy-D-arabinoheptulosonate-7-phosphate synthase [Microbispora sp. NPDC049125]|uniref:chorismate mutase n=1 Tax=Microbispora sp. NPDC049125 TaxID=3154929 RepID=UPI003465964C
MSKAADRHRVRIGTLTVGDGLPVAVIGGDDARWISLRGEHGRAASSDAGGDAVAAARDGWAGPLLVEPFSAGDLAAVARHADGLVIGAAWMQDFGLVRAVARLGLPVVVQRGQAATLEEWLAIADYCVAEGNDRVVLCESGSRTHLGGVTLDFGLMRAARERSGRPVLAALGGDARLAGAAVAAGADGLLLRQDAPAAAREAAREAATVLAPLVRPEAPATVAAARGAIDRTDAALATLLERRAGLAVTVQRLKPVGGFRGRDMDRERGLVAGMAKRAPRLGEARLGPVMNAVIEAGLHLAEEERQACDQALRGAR